MPPTLTERILGRKALWWGPPRPGGRTARDALHRVRERRVLHAPGDPPAAWRCCPAWPRKLVTKPNGRAFALAHGCTVPRLLWAGGDHEHAPFEELGGDFVVRPYTGGGRRGVQVVAGGRDLLSGAGASPQAVRQRLPGRRRPVLVEERVRPAEPGRGLPLEFKLHSFAGPVLAIERLDRRDGSTASIRAYDPSWTPFGDRLTGKLPLGDPVAPPAELPAMLAAASRLGEAIGTYMRIDFFTGSDGLVFNEFAATPLGGTTFAPFCDELFGRAWAERLGDAV